MDITEKSRSNPVAYILPVDAFLLYEKQMFDASHPAFCSVLSRKSMVPRSSSAIVYN